MDSLNYQIDKNNHNVRLFSPEINLFF